MQKATLKEFEQRGAWTNARVKTRPPQPVWQESLAQIWHK